MKKTVLYIAAVLAVSGGLMWQRPMVAHAEPEVIQEAPVSTVLEVAAEEDSDEDNGPAPEIQAAKKLEEELAAAETAAEELPKTGDHTSPAMWLLLIGAGMAASLFVAVSGRRDEE